MPLAKLGLILEDVSRGALSKPEKLMTMIH